MKLHEDYPEIYFEKNQFFECRTSGIYIEGENTHPKIIENTFKYCRCPAIVNM